MSDGAIEQTLKAEERRNQILKAATNVIARKGYHGTTMDDIVRESGLSKGSLYWYFKSKKEILLALTDRFIEAGKDLIVESVRDKTTFAERLKAILDTQLRPDYQGLMEAGSVEERMLAAEFWQQAVIDPDVAIKFQQDSIFWQQFGEELIGQAIQAGEIREVDAAALATILIAILNGLVWEWLLNANQVTEQRIMDSLFDILMRGLLPDQK